MATGERGPRSEIAAAWRRFVAGGELGPGAPGAEHAEAWQRCRRAGVDPRAGRSTRVLAADELERLLEKRRDLVEVARPFMNGLYRFVAGSGFVVLLCDERGYILETVGDPDVVHSEMQVNLERGALWSEEEIGNNGVGTSLFLRRPCQVSGPEHYCRKHHRWTCSGAPVFDEGGRMIGALEMSGPARAAHLHTLGMVVAAAEAIRQQLRVQSANHELTLLNNHLSNLFLSVSDAVVVVEADGRVRQVNPVAEKLLGPGAAGVVGRPFAELLDRSGPLQGMLAEGRSFSDLELNLLVQPEPVRCLASARPIRDEAGAITGGVVFLNPARRINSLVNRLSGAHATFTFDDIIGTARALAEAVQLGIQAAGSESNVLLRGESGTGKEMFAQAIHNRSARRQGPFIAINCGAIPRELVGSELFGYDEGAFTGASRRGRPGKFELAAGGTLFLDEIGDMPLDQQVSLLRVLQDRAITRIGGSRTMLVDVRIIGATNKDLAQEIARGNFRQDLYYRLNVFSITLPPLRELREDIPLMFRTFHERLCRRLGVAAVPVDPEVIVRLQNYDWPGNMREFQNVVEKMVSLPNRGRIGVDGLPAEILVSPASRGELEPLVPVPAGASGSLREHRARIKRSLAEQEHERILRTMAEHGGNLSRTARALGISRTALYRKLGRGETRGN
jgi:sigma-54 dependent transcriptional regulator, acetoin dehydrogenase operon transcriptional activator AcoR